MLNENSQYEKGKYIPLAIQEHNIGHCLLWFRMMEALFTHSFAFVTHSMCNILNKPNNGNF